MKHGGLFCIVMSYKYSALVQLKYFQCKVNPTELEMAAGYKVACRTRFQASEDMREASAEREKALSQAALSRSPPTLCAKKMAAILQAANKGVVVKQGEKIKDDLMKRA